MRETRADTRRAVASALVLHLLLFGLMFAGLLWTRTSTPLSATGPVIEADLIDPNALAAPLRRALDAPADEPAAIPDLTERKRQQAAEQKRLAEQARQQEIADKLAKIRAERAKAAKQAKLAEQKLKQLEDAQSRNAAEAAAQADATATASPPPGNAGQDNDPTGLGAPGPALPHRHPPDPRRRGDRGQGRPELPL